MQEYDVGFGVLPEYAEGLAVGRELEEADRVGLKVCDLATAGTIERLEPQVVHTVFANGIYNSVPSRRESWILGDSRIRVEQLHRRLWPCIERNQNDFINRAVRIDPVH